MNRTAWMLVLLGACSGGSTDDDKDDTPTDIDADADTDADADADADTDADTDTPTGDTAVDVAGAAGVWQGQCDITFKKAPVTYLMDLALVDDGTGVLDGFGFIELVKIAPKKKTKKSLSYLIAFDAEGTFDGVDAVDLDIRISGGKALPFTATIDEDVMDGFLLVGKKKKKGKQVGLDCELDRTL
ncbi:MAG: hypothetical protein KTR31_25625 [Myxococcales bacterium]|nr:hypothetical protein [Myxococcales bacterium]